LSIARDGREWIWSGVRDLWFIRIRHWYVVTVAGNRHTRVSRFGFRVIFRVDRFALFSVFEISFEVCEIPVVLTRLNWLIIIGHVSPPFCLTE
jgi:hypothetical protein